MKTLYLGMWDNSLDKHPKRLLDLHRVIDTVEVDGAVRVSFSYDGRTRHDSSSRHMKQMIEETGRKYKYWIDGNYGFEIIKL